MLEDLRRCSSALAAVVTLAAAAGTHAQTQQSRWYAVQSAAPDEFIRVTLEATTERNLNLRVETPGVLATTVAAPNGRRFTQLSVPGCGASAADYGCPELPFKGFFVEIPRAAQPTVRVESAETVSLGTGLLVYPMQPPLPDDQFSRPPAFCFDDSAYQQDSFLPTSPVVLDKPGLLRGRWIVFVRVFPLLYNPRTTELRAFSTLSFSIELSAAAPPAELAHKARVATPQSEALARALILNYQPIRPATFGDGAQLSDGADYLIIVADHLYDEILPLADWKRRKGFLTRIAKMSEVGSTPADVKAYVQQAYDNWTPAPSYVLLVGDAEDVPPDYFAGSEPCVSDYPYARVAGGDYLADLALGRLPVHTADECAAVVAKLLEYDRTPAVGDWYAKVLSASYFQDNGDGGSQGDNDGIADRWFMETAMTSYDFLVNEQGWGGHTALCTTYWPPQHTVWHFRASSYPHRADLNQIRWGASPRPDPVPSWIPDMWTSAGFALDRVLDGINAGVGLVLHRDHGAETYWGDPPFGTFNVKTLTNGNMTPVVLSVNCLTGSFHRAGGDCLCEAFIKKAPGGCVGIMGATRVSWSGYNELICHGVHTCFWPAYDPSYGQSMYACSWRPGEAVNFGKYYMWTYYGLTSISVSQLHMYQWFGDPEMMLRTAAPRGLLVDSPHSVPVGEPTDVTISVKVDGSPLAEALVAITHPTGPEHWRGLTGSDGVVSFSGITFSQAGEYDLVVTAHNTTPCETTIAAVSGSLGDLNCDGEVDFGDINPFVLALTDPVGYAAAFPQCDINLADINADGKVDFGDINPFIHLLTQPWQDSAPRPDPQRLNAHAASASGRRGSGMASLCRLRL